MKPILLIAIVLVCAIAFISFRVSRAMGQTVVHEPTAAPAPADADKVQASPLNFVVKDIDGKDYDLQQLKGKVVMIVNVASKCGLTPQYEGLEKLYSTYKDKGLVIVGFPANNFNGQEPGTNEEIKTFCTSKYNVTFPMMSKISVKGDDKHPLYKFLTEESTAGDFKGDIGWNFTKFLVDRNGNLFARFGSKTKPADEQIKDAIEKGLAAKG
jgi:glutathione peroxidase